jgi:hypothetical protein
MSGRQHCCLGFWKVFLDRNDLTTATSLERSGAVVFIVQKVLERSQQERAQPAFLLVSAGQAVLLEQMSEETLNKVLGIGGRESAVPKKTVKRWPIGFAKTGERPLSRVSCFLLARAQHDGPMRRLKRSTTLLQRSRDRFRSLRVAERTRFCQKNRAERFVNAKAQIVAASLSRCGNQYRARSWFSLLPFWTASEMSDLWRLVWLSLAVPCPLPSCAIAPMLNAANAIATAAATFASTDSFIRMAR